MSKKRIGKDPIHVWKNSPIVLTHTRFSSGKESKVVSKERKGRGLTLYSHKNKLTQKRKE